MGWYSGKSCRLITMMVLTSSFFFAEIITGYATHSVALIADSFHMLLDIISLIVGFVAIKMSSKTSSKTGTGWQRSEALGALVNSVILLSLCFTIVVEAIQRFMEIEEINDPLLVLIVGCIGLVVNLLGLCLFSSHGMSHGHSHGGGGHGHSHGGVGHGHSHNGHSHLNGSAVHIQGETQLEESGIHLNPEIDHHQIDVETQGASSAQLNMRGVFLHVLGDALGSIVVIISALIILFAEGTWRFYVDPALSVIIVLIIISTTIPLFKESSKVLLQSLPTDLNMFDIESRLVKKVHGIESIHEFHVWQLSGDKNMATAHICFRSMEDYVETAGEIKSFLHEEGIQSTTIQPEFPDNGSLDSINGCALICPPDECKACEVVREMTQPPSPEKKESDDSTCQISTQTVADELDMKGIGNGYISREADC